jgi:N-acetylmuramoyl-L-alanine amidase
MTDEEMKEVYGNYDYDITKAYKGTAENLNKVLKGVLAGKGQAFMDAQKKYGINAAALAAICMLESGNGSSAIAKENNNVSGMGGQGNWKKFNSVEECIDKTASLLKNNYITPPEKGKVKSLTKLYQINSRYCPGKETASNTGWAAKVTQNLKKIEKA